MTSRYDVKLNNVSLSSVNDNLLIIDVAYQTESSTEQMRIANRDGARLSDRYRSANSVTVTFELHEYDIVKRQSALQDVIAWARNGGVLKINDRKNQSLRVVCDALPNISVRNWTEALTITFSAYAYPYWQNTSATVATLVGKNTSGSLKLDGTAPKAYVDVSVTTTAKLTSLTVKVGDTSISLSDLNIAANKTITFSYSSSMVLSIKCGSDSLLSKRTAKSSDDLVAVCGATNTIKITASSNVTATFSAKGAWL